VERVVLNALLISRRSHDFCYRLRRLRRGYGAPGEKPITFGQAREGIVFREADPPWAGGTRCPQRVAKSKCGFAA